MGRYSNFNTQGQSKCGYCGDYYPEGWSSHGCRQELQANFDSSPDEEDGSEE